MNGGKEKGRALREEFTAKKYHQPKDEWSESLDFTGTANDVALIYDVGRSLANSEKVARVAGRQRVQGAARQVGQQAEVNAGRAYVRCEA